MQDGTVAECPYPQPDRQRFILPAQHHGSLAGKYAFPRERRRFGNRLKRFGGFLILGPLVRVRPGVLMIGGQGARTA